MQHESQKRKNLFNRVVEFKNFRVGLKLLDARRQLLLLIMYIVTFAAPARENHTLCNCLPLFIG